MAVGDVKTAQGLNDLNQYLAEKSYVSGYTPSQADVQVFEQVGKAPAANLPHVLRWYNQIASYTSAERKTWSQGTSPLTAGAKPTAPAPAAKDDDDDDVDLFGSGDEEEDAEAERIREERLKAYADKKSKKPALIAKSSILLDVKPWDDETDMKEMENQVRTIEMEGLLWGASKLVPVGYGINKLQIMCVIEDDKVSVDLLTEKIQEFEDFVQSVDIAAFNKI
ncbi:elongation factor 1-beta' [Bombyx mori]|uniref:Elongation factor 1-beta' n=3 Tax=cellular organisms TaxID=131567 RepID=EF1B2_BOMMO|nr:elongation factor 1-beta' [Bombyx mori]P29522.2 RecName: Full=Elongation factor 1-beta' [Bombyx mori]BAA02602.1 elongation factor 1 beta' [Bombyx mori]